MLKFVTEELAIGCITEPEALKQLAAKGYRTLIDLCPAAEGNRMDAAEVENLGIQYVNIPVSPKNLTEQTLQTFKQTLRTAPKPTYVRCTSGLRAGVLTLLALAEERKWTEAEYRRQLQALGLEHKPGCPLAAFAQSQLKSDTATSEVA